MIIWIFTILDMLVLVSVGLNQFGNPPLFLLLLSSGYLIIKGSFFFKEFMSKIDVAIGVYILFMAIFGFATFLEYLIFLWFLYKFVFMIVGS